MKKSEKSVAYLFTNLIQFVSKSFRDDEMFYRYTRRNIHSHIHKQTVTVNDLIKNETVDVGNRQKNM